MPSPLRIADIFRAVYGLQREIGAISGDLSANHRHGAPRCFPLQELRSFASQDILTGCGKSVVARSGRAGLQPRRKARPNTFNNLWSGRRHGGAEAPPFRGPE